MLVTNLYQVQWTATVLRGILWEGAHISNWFLRPGGKMRPVLSRASGAFFLSSIFICGCYVMACMVLVSCGSPPMFFTFPTYTTITQHLQKCLRAGNRGLDNGLRLTRYHETWHLSNNCVKNWSMAPDKENTKTIQSIRSPGALLAVEICPSYHKFSLSTSI